MNQWTFWDEIRYGFNPLVFLGGLLAISIASLALYLAWISVNGLLNGSGTVNVLYGGARSASEVLLAAIVLGALSVLTGAFAGHFWGDDFQD